LPVLSVPANPARRILVQHRPLYSSEVVVALADVLGEDALPVGSTEALPESDVEALTIVRGDDELAGVTTRCVGCRGARRRPGRR